jgi:Cu/Ag efflux pump CusA
MIAGIAAGSYYHDQQIFDVTVWSDPNLRKNVTDVGRLPIASPAGGRVALDQIASVTVQPSPTAIAHDRASRYVDVTASVEGGNLGGVISNATDNVRAIALPLGYRAEVFSDVASERSASFNVWLAIVGVVIAIYLLLQAAFRSWSRSTLLFFTLPLAVVGVLPAAFLAGSPLGLTVLVGLLLVFSVAVRNGVVLIRNFQRLEDDPAEQRSGRDAVLTGTRQAAGPVLITAVGIALWLAPFVVRGNIAGMEIMRPLGISVIGGLVTSTMLTLIVVPALYLRFIARPSDAQTQPAEGGA